VLFSHSAKAKDPSKVLIFETLSEVLFWASFLFTFQLVTLILLEWVFASLCTLFCFLATVSLWGSWIQRGGSLFLEICIIPLYFVLIFCSFGLCCVSRAMKNLHFCGNPLSLSYFSMVL
jgi:hypothetical protein